MSLTDQTYECGTWVQSRFLGTFDFRFVQFTTFPPFLQIFFISFQMYALLARFCCISKTSTSIQTGSGFSLTNKSGANAHAVSTVTLACFPNCCFTVPRTCS
ncbi:hypothetical protein BCR44DRAFT_185370 [Catenaria anguillulae PL171]|uniref:Uncharacterized protein n=1 Tax=Catenaria anguillulae PL171 TaxID=765915 RepID=A0A1Y2HVH8_9FUNG|nr:hypothetical protein BCR44DRAFT_185370 [Catenaria anguillulae PL171]